MCPTIVPLMRETKKEQDIYFTSLIETMKILVATEKPFAKKAVDGIRKIVEDAGYELALLEKYPHYVFNFEGAVKYAWAKEYYPERYERLKKYVAEGRWHLTPKGMLVSNSILTELLLAQEHSTPLARR